MCHATHSPLETLETTFHLLATGPQPLALDGHTIGLSRDSIGLWELRAMLFHPAVGVGVQRAALVQLVERARRLRGAWLVGLAGVLLPGLRQQVACLPGGPSRSTTGSGGMALVGLLERLDDAGLSHESAADSLLRTIVRPRDAPTRPSRRRPHLAPVPGGTR
jgi:hypothetical protein